MSSDPNFFRSQHPDSYPTLPIWVTGFAFDPATRTFEFSAVRGFDLSRLQYLRRIRTGRTLYGRYDPPPYGLSEVDGVPVKLPPMAERVLKVAKDCAVTLATNVIPPSTIHRWRHDIRPERAAGQRRAGASNKHPLFFRLKGDSISPDNGLLMVPNGANAPPRAPSPCPPTPPASPARNYASF